MEKHLNSLKISSISDIITNSSSEVFLIDMNDDYKEFMEELDYVREDVASAIRENMHEFHKLNDVKEYIDQGGDFNDLSIFDRDRDSMSYYDDKIWDFMFKHDSTPPNENQRKRMWSTCKKSYESVIGKAMIIIDDIDDNVVQDTDLMNSVIDKICDSNMKYKRGHCG